VLALAAFALVCVLTVLQARRDETRRVDAVLVLSPSHRERDGTTRLFRHALALYQQGYVSHVVVVAPQQQAAEEFFSTHYVPANVVSVVEGEGNNHPQDIRAALTLAYEQGIHTLLVVDAPEAMLLDLKVARDLGFQAHGSPPPGEALRPGEIVRAAGDYWEYVLLTNSTVLP
jgi:hypothetical protein